ncbi:MAG: hypothetical protein AAGA21_03845 [Pseudomonadota bacterium]
MSRSRHLILCGGASVKDAGENIVRLQLNGPGANVTLLLQDISRRLVVNIPDVLIDLLEIAAYVYAADTAVSRGGLVSRQMGADWRRSLDFVIPVRCPEVWDQECLSELLSGTLSDLSEDDFRFRFERLQRAPVIADYLEFGDDDHAGFAPDNVILFSGGLDSLAGTIEALESGQRSVALVSHRFGGAVEKAQKDLVADLRQTFGADRIFHVPVLATVANGVSKEATHRTRSFLFAALGAVLARLFRVDDIKLFENGIISFHLPLSPQVIGARATRTTHPKVLAGFKAIFSMLFGNTFNVDNPFVWDTKAEILKRMAERGHGGLIRDSRSCAHVREMTNMHPHCGRCSQCIDRRFAVLAAGLADQDPEEAYKVQLFTDPRPEGPERELTLGYVRTRADIERMEDVAFFAHYGEIGRALRHFPISADETARRILDLHRRHAVEVGGVVEREIQGRASALRHGDLPDDCLLVLIAGKHASSPYSDQPENPAHGQSRLEPPGKPLNIQMAIDHGNRNVIFEHWGKLGGANAALLTTLADKHAAAIDKRRLSENFPFVASADLAETLGYDGDEPLRKCVQRCRKKIAAMAKQKGMALQDPWAVIENLPRHGYRLNPVNVRLVAVDELKPKRLKASA